MARGLYIPAVHPDRGSVANAYEGGPYRPLGGVAGGGDLAVMALALTRNVKVWALMVNGQITGTSAQLAGIQASLTI